MAVLYATDFNNMHHSELKKQRALNTECFIGICKNPTHPIIYSAHLDLIYIMKEIHMPNFSKYSAVAPLASLRINEYINMSTTKIDSWAFLHNSREPEAHFLMFYQAEWKPCDLHETKFTYLIENCRKAVPNGGPFLKKMNLYEFVWDNDKMSRSRQNWNSSLIEILQL